MITASAGVRGADDALSSQPRMYSQVTPIHSARTTTSTTPITTPCHTIVHRSMPASSTIWRNSRPIRPNAMPVTSSSATCQKEALARRSSASTSESAALICTAATTTAMTPDAWISSAGRYTTNGMTRVGPLRPGTFTIRTTSHEPTQPDARPISTAATAVYRKCSTSNPKCRSSPAMVAASAAWNATSAAASLNRPSVCRTPPSRRGIPTGSATASTATGSGGAVIAPIAMAAARVMPGTSAHSSGGRIRSGSSSTCGMPGRNAAPAVTSVSSTGQGARIMCGCATREYFLTARG